jgi:hypothetical protein
MDRDVPVAAGPARHPNACCCSVLLELLFLQFVRMHMTNAQSMTPYCSMAIPQRTLGTSFSKVHTWLHQELGSHMDRPLALAPALLHVLICGQHHLQQQTSRNM